MKSRLIFLLGALLVISIVSAENCPSLMPPSPDFCRNGTIISGERNANGCVNAPRCVTKCPAVIDLFAIKCPDGTEAYPTKDGNGCTVAPRCANTCVAEGSSLGAVVPGNTNECCRGLVACVPDGVLGSRGICRRSCTGRVCPLVYSPVCGIDSVTYGNSCEAGDAKIACKGACPCVSGNGFTLKLGESKEVDSLMISLLDLAQPKCIGCKPEALVKLSIVSGDATGVSPSGKTEVSLLEMFMKEYTFKEGQSVVYRGYRISLLDVDMSAQAVTLQVTKDGCTKEYKPVCGADGRSYDNKCLAGDATLTCEGKCPCRRLTLNVSMVKPTNVRYLPEAAVQKVIDARRMTEITSVNHDAQGNYYLINGIKKERFLWLFTRVRNLTLKVDSDTNELI